ncbi:MAG: archaemetzincin family Zn-dependent metalloprotease [Ignavibacteriaceae bacterium]
MTRSINIAPVKFSNISFFNRIITELRQRFSIQINVIELKLNVEPSFSYERSQYYSTQLLAEAIKLTANIDGKVLLLTEGDLYIPVLTFVFGEAQLNGKHSIVSVCRLHEEFYSGISNEELLTERTMKEVLHELGHNFGLKHCLDWDCVMHTSPGIEEVDIKGGSFCHKCAASVDGYKIF